MKRVIALCVVSFVACLYGLGYVSQFDAWWVFPTIMTGIIGMLGACFVVIAVIADEIG